MQGERFPPHPRVATTARGGDSPERGHVMSGAIPALLFQILEIYKWIVIAAVIASWLVNFNVINIRNQFVRMIVSALYALTEPVFAQIRRIIPTFGGLDLSPIVVLLIIFFLQNWLITGRLF
jgi:YggT family protein